MNEIVIEHVKVSELPEAWRQQLSVSENARGTVRIEAEPAAGAAAEEDIEESGRELSGVSAWNT